MNIKKFLLLLRSIIPLYIFVSFSSLPASPSITSFIPYRTISLCKQHPFSLAAFLCVGTSYTLYTHYKKKFINAVTYIKNTQPKNIPGAADKLPLEFALCDSKNPLGNALNLLINNKELSEQGNFSPFQQRIRDLGLPDIKSILDFKNLAKAALTIFNGALLFSSPQTYRTLQQLADAHDAYKSYTERLLDQTDDFIQAVLKSKTRIYPEVLLPMWWDIKEDTNQKGNLSKQKNALAKLIMHESSSSFLPEELVFYLHNNKNSLHLLALHHLRKAKETEEIEERVDILYQASSYNQAEMKRKCGQRKALFENMDPEERKKNIESITPLNLSSFIANQRDKLHPEAFKLFTSNQIQSLPPCAFYSVSKETLEHLIENAPLSLLHPRALAIIITQNPAFSLLSPDDQRSLKNAFFEMLFTEEGPKYYYTTSPIRSLLDDYPEDQLKLDIENYFTPDKKLEETKALSFDIRTISIFLNLFEKNKKTNTLSEKIITKWIRTAENNNSTLQKDKAASESILAILNPSDPLKGKLKKRR